MKRILIFSYYSYKDPVFQSAVLPYFEASNANCEYVLLTWEQKQFALTSDEINTINKNLDTLNIKWYRTTWHSGKLKLLKKAFDFSWGFIFSLWLIIRYKIKYIYSEGFPGAVIGHYLSLVTRAKHVVHTFEPHADYMEEAGVWKKTSWEYRLLKYHEIKVAKNAFRVITATKLYKHKLINEYHVDGSKIAVLKSCVDTNRFKFKPDARSRIRKSLNIDDNQIVLCYLGKLGGMYMDQELFEFISNCFNAYPEKFYFMIFNSLANEAINERLKEHNIPVKCVFHKYLNKAEVSDFLSAADFGVVAVRPYRSKLFCSPIKNGEYLATGLPLIIPYNVSEDVEDIKKHKLLGICLNEKEFRCDTLVGNKLISFYETSKKAAVVEACHSYAKVTRDITLGIKLVNEAFS